ncbi:MAG: hypothetical protein WBV71_18610, partial [Roseobacter sp.]
PTQRCREAAYGSSPISPAFPLDHGWHMVRIMRDAGGELAQRLQTLGLTLSNLDDYFTCSLTRCFALAG